MGRYLSGEYSGKSRTPGVAHPDPSMPISGVFGTGRVAFITETQTFTIPAETIRVRCFGGGGFGFGGGGGGGGGFAMKVISGLTPGSTVTATVGMGGSTSPANGGTTSFGAHVSATGGSASVGGVGGVGGDGVGGDINHKGGTGGNSIGTVNGGGGGVANLLGNGGGGLGANSGSINLGVGGGGGHDGSLGVPGLAPIDGWSVDFVGCGSGTGGNVTTSAGGRAERPNAGNGGGGGSGQPGTFPGGGGGGGTGFPGANGLIIVEW